MQMHCTVCWKNRFCPCFTKRDQDNIPRGWVAMMREAIRTVGSKFSMRRMVKEYTEKYYIPALQDILDLEAE